MTRRTNGGMLQGPKEGNAMSEKLTGGCLCGKVRYEIEAEPLFAAHCSCRDCQKASGAGHTTIFAVPAEAMRLQGEVATYTNTGDSGQPVTRHFCPVCAGRLFTTGDSAGPIRIVQAGSLDEPGRIQPAAAIYRKDAVAWDYIDPALPSFEAMPPPR